jgi:hypothetical protein
VPVYKAEGVVLGRRNLGEADRILTLFTREFGRLQAKAKAVRKTTSRLAQAAWSPSPTPPSSWRGERLWTWWRRWRWWRATGS